MRKAICLACLAVCLAMISPVAAAAEGKGSIHVKLEVEDLAVTNGAVTLYQVGTSAEEGFQIREEFGGGMIRQTEADADMFGRWLAASATEAGITMLLDADGNADFTELEDGLYMLVQTQRMDGFYPIYPVLISIPNAEGWNAEIRREPAPVVTVIPKTGQSPIPFLGVLGMVLSSAGLILCCKKDRKQ